MSFTENKLEIAIGGLALVLAGGLFHVFSGMHAKASVESDIVYEMPRPKGFQGSDFDLSGREIDRNYINPFVKKENPVKGSKGAETPAAKAAAKAAAAKKAAAAVAKKTPQVTTRVVEATPGATLGAGNETPSPRYTNNTAPVRSTAAQNNTSGDTAADNDSGKRSPAQWRALLLAQPTQANMNQLIEARNKAEVDEDTYNSIVTDLLKSSNAEVQEVGLYGAKTFPTYRSFEIVAQAEDSLATTQKTEAQAFLKTYGKGARLSALMSVFRSTDQSVVAKASEVLIAGYQEAKSGTSSDPRAGRGEIGSSALTNYTKFVPILQQLAQSGDSALAALANSTLAQIQTA